MNEQPGHIPDLLLEQYLLGELPEHRRRELDAYARTAAGAARLEALRASNHEILSAHPPALVAEHVARAAGRARRERARASAGTRLILVAVVVLVALGMVWYLVGWSGGRTRGTAPAPIAQATAPSLDRVGPEHEDGLRGKGLQPRLVIYRRGTVAEGAEVVVPGTIVSPRDVLQIGYVAAARPHGVLLSIDGRGVVTLHHPERAGGSTALVPGGEVLLGHAYELDDAPAFERFFFVTSYAALDVDRILQSARDLAARPDAASGALTLPPDVEQVSVLLGKTAVPGTVSEP